MLYLQIILKNMEVFNLEDKSFSTILNETRSIITEKASLLELSKNKKKYINLYGNSFLNFYGGELIILGSRPSIGRTNLAISWLREFALSQHLPVGFISCGNLDTYSIAKRILSQETSIAISKIQNGELKESEFKKIENTMKHISNAPIYIKDCSTEKFEAIEEKAKKLVSEQGIKILFIDEFDYLFELTDFTDYSDFYEVWHNSYQDQNEKELYYFKVEQMMKKLKRFALSLNIPVVVLKCVARSSTGHLPGLHSFKGNIWIPKLADMVILVDRWREPHVPVFSPAMLMIPKGPTNRGSWIEVINMEYSNMTGEFRYKET